MKHKQISMKWKVFAYMLIFISILLVVLWIFQIVYLDNFYKYIKLKSVENASHTIANNISNETIEDTIETIALKDEVCILVTDKEGNEIYSMDETFNCIIHNMQKKDFENFYQMAVNNGGESIFQFDGMEGRKRFEGENMIPPFEEIQNQNRMPWDKKNIKFEMESVISIKIIEKEGVEYVIFLNALISPVDATVKTLRIQFIYLAVVLMLLSLICALLISRNISQPIIVINKSAKELAKGNFSIHFAGKGYREISELSTTLNYTANELSKTENLQRELIANTSHDLRTPLTMITAYAEIMRDLPGENTPDNVQVIIDEANRLTTLVNDMLEISKLQAGASDLQLNKCDLTSSIKKVLERYKKLTEQGGYTIKFEYDRNIFVYADELKIFQVVYNLINNAINYTGSDKQVIVRQVIKNNKVRLEIIDHGKGIEKDELPFIWERYYKVDKTHKRAVFGTGLGLSIVKNIVNMHNGTYGVESEIDKGSIFWFELDIA